MNAPLPRHLPRGIVILAQYLARVAVPALLTGATPAVVVVMKTIWMMGVILNLAQHLARVAVPALLTSATRAAGHLAVLGNIRSRLHVLVPLVLQSMM